MIMRSFVQQPLQFGNLNLTLPARNRQHGEKKTWPSLSIVFDDRWYVNVKDSEDIQNQDSKYRLHELLDQRVRGAIKRLTNPAHFAECQSWLSKGDKKKVQAAIKQWLLQEGSPFREVITLLLDALETQRQASSQDASFGPRIESSDAKWMHKTLNIRDLTTHLQPENIEIKAAKSGKGIIKLHFPWANLLPE